MEMEMIEERGGRERGGVAGDDGDGNDRDRDRDIYLTQVTLHNLQRLGYSTPTKATPKDKQ